MEGLGRMLSRPVDSPASNIDQFEPGICLLDCRLNLGMKKRIDR